MHDDSIKRGDPDYKLKAALTKRLQYYINELRRRMFPTTAEYAKRKDRGFEYEDDLIDESAPPTKKTKTGATKIKKPAPKAKAPKHNVPNANSNNNMSSNNDSTTSSCITVIDDDMGEALMDLFSEDDDDDEDDDQERRPNRFRRVDECKARMVIGAAHHCATRGQGFSVSFRGATVQITDANFEPVEVDIFTFVSAYLDFMKMPAQTP
jgi:hypothetical protein